MTFPTAAHLARETDIQTGYEACSWNGIGHMVARTSSEQAPRSRRPALKFSLLRNRTQLPSNIGFKPLIERRSSSCATHSLRTSIGKVVDLRVKTAFRSSTAATSLGTTIFTS